MVFLNMPAARSYGGRGPRMKMYPSDAIVPVVKSGTGLDLVPDGTPAKFTKKEADSLAHNIGRYMLGFGDFVSSYTEEIR